MSEYTLSMGMTWDRLGEIIRSGYLSGYGGSLVALREAEFDRWLAEVERAAAARALDEAANEINLKRYIGAGLECANAETTSGVWLRARAAEIREERT